MLHPAILKAKFQRAHITGCDQFARLHRQIRNDLLNQLVALAQADATGSAEGQVVGAKRGAGEPQAQAAVLGELKECASPSTVVGLIGVQAQVMGLIGNCQGAGKAPLAQVFA